MPTSDGFIITFDGNERASDTFITASDRNESTLSDSLTNLTKAI